ncbi:MAG: hypothetical protein AB2A00_43550 [Myxococcota bacterium]
MRALYLAVVLGLSLAAACQDSAAGAACRSTGACVDCTSVCHRMIQCRVSYAAAETPVPISEDSSDQERCEQSCFTTDTITPERERCILATNPAQTERCQKQVLACLGVDGGPSP